MKEITTADMLRLALLMMSVGTIALSAALVIFYRKSLRLPHVLPLAISYVWISLVVTLRGWDLIALEPALWNCLGAYTVGNVGLLLLLMRPWPRSQ